jgi:hypothetical protein
MLQPLLASRGVDPAWVVRGHADARAHFGDDRRVIRRYEQSDAACHRASRGGATARRANERLSLIENGVERGISYAAAAPAAAGALHMARPAVTPRREILELIAA